MATKKEIKMQERVRQAEQRIAEVLKPVAWEVQQVRPKRIAKKHGREAVSTAYIFDNEPTAKEFVKIQNKGLRQNTSINPLTKYRYRIKPILGISTLDEMEILAKAKADLILCKMEATTATINLHS